MSSPEYFPSYDSPEPDEPHAQWKWNHFEVRTLVCLIIKGEHRASKDPMNLTDKLNHALNPASTGGQADYSRDVPHAEVQAMMKRILSKKWHAVDLSSRDYSGTLVTRTKVNAFMRNLDFKGSKNEWVMGRKKDMQFETQKRLERYMVRKEGGRPSPRSREERDRRRMLLREPRARRLLHGWGIGASFWEDEPKAGDRPVNRDDHRDSCPVGHFYKTANAPFLPTGLTPAGANTFGSTPNASNSVAMWAGGFASTAATPLHGVVAHPFMPDMPDMPGPNSTQQAQALDYGGNEGYGGDGGYGGYGGFGDPRNPEQQPHKWAGGEQNGTHGTK
ncbi:hypothetical protein DHEL01_v208223 [Diaporthe helianthi]|uniref:Uncharacterized protein n=1 Tax=Diaporthe helianthi TaxID=158607 RepID=A0A2P5HSY2_DIAHE|nr:hypothetical protein DHEL01_v208223 [Diaporthe helianthi]